MKNKINFFLIIVKVLKRATNLPFLPNALIYKALRRARLGQVYAAHLPEIKKVI